MMRLIPQALSGLVGSWRKSHYAFLRHQAKRHCSGKRKEWLSPAAHQAAWELELLFILHYVFLRKEAKRHCPGKRKEPLSPAAYQAAWELDLLFSTSAKSHFGRPDNGLSWGHWQVEDFPKTGRIGRFLSKLEFG